MIIEYRARIFIEYCSGRNLDGQTSGQKPTTRVTELKPKCFKVIKDVYIMMLHYGCLNCLHYVNPPFLKKLTKTYLGRKYG